MFKSRRDVGIGRIQNLLDYTNSIAIYILLMDNSNIKYVLNISFLWVEYRKRIRLGKKL